MRYLCIIAILELLLYCSCTSRQRTDALVYKMNMNDSVRAMLKAGNRYRRDGDYTNAIHWYKKALITGKAISDLKGTAESYRNIVFVYSTILNQYDRAIHYSDEALQLGHSLNDVNTLCDMYSMRAVVFQVAGKLDSAVVANKQALYYFDKDTAPDSLKHWSLYVNIANLYDDLGNPHLAIEYTHKYLDEYVLKVKDTARMITAYSNLSTYYTSIHDTVQARNNIYKAYYLLQTKPGVENEDAVLSNMFVMYHNNRLYDSAIAICNRRMETAQDNKDVYNQHLVLSDMMDIVISRSDTMLAKKVLQYGVNMPYLLGDELPLYNRKTLTYGYYRIFKMLGHKEQANILLPIAYDNAEAFRTLEKNKELERYELERKKVMQEKLLLAKQVQIKNKNNTILVLITGLLVCCIIAGVWLYRYKRKMLLQHQHIVSLKKEGEWNRTRSLLEGQLNERNRISRELHDELGASLTSISLASKIIQSKTGWVNEEINLISSTASEMIANLNEIVWMMNNRNDSLLGLAAYIRKFASRFLAQSVIRMHDNSHLPEDDLTVTSNIRRAIYLSTKEALNNIVKHSEATDVHLQIDYTEQILQVTIKDNGKGLSTVTTNINGHNGLHNMQKNMEQVGGGMSIADNEGVTIILSCPVFIDNTTIG